MPIESGTTLSELDQLWPLSGDPVLSGDNHLRLLKAVLKAQFPGALGQGLDTPILADETELNYLQGLNANVQVQLSGLAQDIIDAEAEYTNNLYAPAGTILVFYQATPPTGWTQITADNDSLLRVVSSGVTGGSAGGTDSPTNYTPPSHVHTTGDHVLTVAQIPPHAHTFPFRFIDSTGDTEGASGRSDNGTTTTSSTGSGSAHNHGNTGSGGSTAFTPKYINVIQASKD
jgi:hypothetical protein